MSQLPHPTRSPKCFVGVRRVPVKIGYFCGRRRRAGEGPSLDGVRLCVVLQSFSEIDPVLPLHVTIRQDYEDREFICRRGPIRPTGLSLRSSLTPTTQMSGWADRDLGYESFTAPRRKVVETSVSIRKKGKT